MVADRSSARNSGFLRSLPSQFLYHIQAPKQITSRIILPAQRLIYRNLLGTISGGLESLDQLSWIIGPTFGKIDEDDESKPANYGPRAASLSGADSA